MREVMDAGLPLFGPLLAALPLVMWARYFLIRFGEDDEVPRLRVPLVTTGVFALVIVVVVVLEEPVA